MDLKSVFSYLGFVLVALAVAMLIPFLASLIFDDGVYIPFLLSAFISCVIGIILVKKFRRETLTLGSAMILAGLSFLCVSLVGSIVYLDHLQPLDALFESVSGFTTTGLTTVAPESLPYSILLWRSLTQWLGGLGTLVMIVLLLSSPGLSAYYMYRSEAKTFKLESNVLRSARKIFTIYGVYTLAGVLLFMLAGMPAFDSVNHSLTAISSGGFSIKDASIGHYSSLMIEIVALVLMIIGATALFVHTKLFEGKFREYLRNSETQLFWLFAAVFSALLTLSFLSVADADPLTNGVFHAFAALTSSAFNLGVAGYPELSKFILIMAMLIGGFAGSLAGGLRLARVGILGKAVTWISKKIFYPTSAVVPFRFNRRTIDDQELTIISLFSFTYILILIISSMALSFMGYAPADSFFVSASAEGNVGLTSIDIAAMNPAGKVLLMIDMLLGRLEILPFFVLFFVLYSRIRLR